MDAKLTCICVDDELPALKLIEAYCKDLPELDLLGSFYNPIEALSFLEQTKVDLVILDIQMPQLSGIDFFKKVNQHTLGIFVSANPNFALEAFEIDIIDFVLKPASFPRFQKAIQKTKSIFEIKSKEENSPYILVKEDYITQKIHLDDVLYIQGSGEYLKIVTAHKSYLLFERMKEFEQNYAHSGIIRIHKSYLVVKNQIEQVSFSSVKLKNGTVLPLGRAYKTQIKST